MHFIDFARRNRIITIVILVLGVTAVFWILWFVGATKYQSVVDNWIRLGRWEGYEISYDRREEFGFPKQTVLRFTNVRWKNTDGIEFHAGDLDISAGLWETKNFKAKFKGQVEIDAPGDPDHYSLILAGEAGSVEVKLSDDGLWEDCSLSMKMARVGRAPDYIFLADAIKLSAHRPSNDPKTAKEAGLNLSSEFENITLPAAMPPTFGSKMSSLQVDLRLMGPVPDFRKKSSVEAWNKLNGLVDFDRFNMEWGPLLIDSRGTMNFDDDNQPEGVFAAVVGHQDQVLDKLTKGGFIAATQQDILGSAMRLLAKPAKVQGADGVEVPIAIQLGGFFFGPVKIFAYPPIEWE